MMTRLKLNDQRRPRRADSAQAEELDRVPNLNRDLAMVGLVVWGGVLWVFCVIGEGGGLRSRERGGMV